MHTDFAWCDTADGACIDVTINALVILKLHDLLVTFFRGYELSIFFFLSQDRSSRSSTTEGRFESLMLEDVDYGKIYGSVLFC